MAKSRSELDALLNALEGKIPALIEEHLDIDSFWPVFAGEADVIEDSASAADHEYVRGRIDAMLAKNCLVPDDG